MTDDEYGSAQHGVVANYQALETLTQPQLEAEVRAAGLGTAFATRLTAAWIHGIRRGGRAKIEMLTVRARKPVLSDITVRTTNFLPPHHVTVVNGIPVTTVARTLVDLSSCFSHETWKRIASHTVRAGATTYEEIRQVREEMRARARRRTTRQSWTWNTTGWTTARPMACSMTVTATTTSSWPATR